MPKTLHETYRAGLLALGYTIDSRYNGSATKFTRPDLKEAIFLGQRDSLRRGKSRTDSRQVNDDFRTAVLYAGGWRKPIPESQADTAVNVSTLAPVTLNF